MMPDYRIDNPYQSLLAGALQKEGVDVQFPGGYRRVFPIYRAIKKNPEPTALLHLHWIDPYLKGNNIFIKLIYCCKFLVDILLTRWIGVKVVWTVHNIVSHNARFPRLELWTQRILVKLADRVIVHYTTAIDEVIRQYKFSASKISVIPHGHYRDIYQPPIDPIEARQKLGLPESGRIYLNLGILQPYKGIEQLVKLWKNNQTSLVGNTLLIVGKALDNSYGQVLAKQTSKTSGLIFQDTFIENDQIHLYLSAADIVVLPYRQILTSGSVLLAMSYGKPIIAPRLGCIPEVLASANDLLYDPNDPEGLLNAINLSQRHNLQDLSRRTTACCNLLGWQKIGVDTKQVYEASFISCSSVKSMG